MRCSVQLKPFQAQHSSFKARIVHRNITRTYIVASQQTPKSSSYEPSSTGLGPAVSRLVGATAAAIVLATAPAAFAELQTVAPDQVTSLAKPLKVQTVNKNRIWLLFVLGASSLFGVTVLAENNEAWFPAISRANKALAASAALAKERAKRAEEEQAQFESRLSQVQQETEIDSRLENAVAEGILSARRPSAASPAVDVEIEESTTTASALAAAIEEELKEASDVAAEIPAEPNFPAELGVEEEEEAEELSVAAAAAEQGEEESEAGGASRAAPLFEISGEQIDSSFKNYQQREILNELSIEDLQRELEERKKAARAGGGGGGGNN